MKNKVKIKFFPEAKEFTFKKNILLIHAAEKAGIIIELPCRGEKKCGSCKISVIKGNLPVTKDEKKLLLKKEIKKGIRLACCLKITDDIEIHIPDSIRLYPQKVLSYSPLTEKNIYPFSPPIFKIKEKLKSDKEIFGLAIDLGTTTIEASLINLISGKEISRLQSENPQIRFGADIISRLEYIKKNKKNYQKLHTLLINQINKFLNQFSQTPIMHVVCVGNTFMQYSLTNTYPEDLFKIPFETKFKNITNIKAREFKLNVDKSSLLSLIPGIKNFVGSDISALITSTGLYDTKGKILAIDMGTNGELILSLDGKLICTSCACGPALEGGHIKSGMRAKQGAIESFSWDNKNNLSYKVIGAQDPIGICGSGLIDIIAYLRNIKKLKPNGNLEKNIFKITDKIKITQNDIRQFQLAKAAIRSAISLLLEKENIKVSKLDKILIAGNFGNFTNPNNMIKSTLLPKEFHNKIKFIGNSALSGAKTFLCSEKAIEKVKIITKNTKFINLAENPDFQEKFVKFINFID